MSGTYVSTFDVSSVSPAVLDHITERVNVAAGVLDTLKPGWRSDVDMHTVDMGSHRYCILGQVFGEFSNGMREFKIQAREDGVLTDAYGTTEYFGFASGYHYVDGEERYVSDSMLMHVWSEQVNNGSPMTMRDRLFSGAHRTVERFEATAATAEKLRADLVAEFERVQADYQVKIEQATKRAEQTAATASEARSEFDALTGK